jgi:predicted AAA+ superfamily ATPase
LLLQERTAAPLSLNSLREDPAVSFDTVKHWVELLERLYFCYRIPPFTGSLSRSLTKEKKLYLWDWAEVEDPGARFEGMVASHLLKAVDAWNDLGHGSFELCYWRNREKKEVDFIVISKRKPVAAIECKLSELSPSKSLLDFGKAYPEEPLIQLVADAGVQRPFPGGVVAGAAPFLAGLV